ncbi:MAG: hypothetical protein KGN16_24405 [Burkholderiales bacterium]|nr:hypothetical protein [Burkholderiales bacterium]
MARAETVRRGQLGELRQVRVEYGQDWLAEPLKASGHKQADGGTDPARAGAGGCIGDIGTHAYQLAEYITGMTPTVLCAELSTFVADRAFDDHLQIMLRYANGARGTLGARQVATVHENDLRIAVYGSRGGLRWVQLPAVAPRLDTSRTTR